MDYDDNFSPTPGIALASRSIPSNRSISSHIEHDFSGKVSIICVKCPESVISFCIYWRVAHSDRIYWRVAHSDRIYWRVAHSDRPKHAYLNPMPDPRIRSRRGFASGSDGPLSSDIGTWTPRYSEYSRLRVKRRHPD